MIQFLKTIALGAAMILGISSPAVIQETPIQFGATNPVAGTNYYLAGSGVSGSDTSITLTSLTIPQTGYELQDSDFSDTFYITLEPGNRTRQEIASCTTVTQNANNTATLSGCVRGLLPFTPFTASSSYQFAHGGGTAVVFSNPPQMYNEFMAKNNDSYVTGIHTYASSSLPRASSTPIYGAGDELKFVTYGQLASTSFAGGVDASETSKGVSELATITEASEGTASGPDGRLVIPASMTNSTSSATTTIPVTKSGGKLSQGFLDLTEGFTFSGGITSSATTTLSGNSVLSTTTVGGVDVGSHLSKFGGTGADGALIVTTSTVIDLATSSLFVKNYSSISITGTSTLSFINPNPNGTIIILKSSGACDITSATTTAIDLRMLGGIGGTAGTAAGNTGAAGSGGGGGASTFTDGASGITNTGANGNAGGAASAYGKWAFGKIVAATGGNGNISGYSAGGISPTFASSSIPYFKYMLVPGGGGGGGQGSQTGTGGIGGRGAGSLYVECNGTLNISSGINASGQVGGNVQSTFTTGGGGGGGGGTIIFLAKAIGTNSPTITVIGGTGGYESNLITKFGGDGAAGYYYIGKNTEF